MRCSRCSVQASDQGCSRLRDAHGSRLVLRVSLDHYGKARHEEERGAGTFDKTVDGIDWLARHGFTLALAGRTCWGEDEADERAGYAALIAERGWPIDAHDPAELVLFPEMDERAEVPEITTGCWSILHKSPHDVMCASSRMVVKRKGEPRPAVLPCTLLPYDPAFEMGATLAEAASADGGMFDARRGQALPSALRQVLRARWRKLLGVRPGLTRGLIFTAN